MARSLVFLDFEYNDRGVILCCCLDVAEGSRVQFDLRHPEAVSGQRDHCLSMLHAYVAARMDHVWVSYSAQAELDSLLRLGFEPATLRQMTWVCCLAEAAMLTGTLNGYRLRRPKLLDHLATFDIPHDEGAVERKQAMRDLIIHRDAWSEEEWDDIVRYCWSDIEPLPALLSKIRRIHAAKQSPWKPEDAFRRGEYLIAAAVLSHRSQGLPVNVPLMQRIFANRHAIRNALSQRCNEHYGHEIYRKVLSPVATYPETGRRTCEISYSFSHAGLEAFLETQPFFDGWEKTPSGRRRLDDDYLDDLIRDQPSLIEFRFIRSTLQQLKDDRLLSLEHDGYIKPHSTAFYTVTGRMQPWVNKGFILNSPPWLRSIIHPHPGMALLALDWSKQEIGIACGLSRDPKLHAAFESGDMYLELARMAHAVPQDAVAGDEQHALSRQAYKSVQLGLGFGMGQRGLAKKLYTDLNDGKATVETSRATAVAKAAEVYLWHKETFSTYWTYLHCQAERAKLVGWTASADNWLYFADRYTSLPKLLNFPMQSNGAAMLREAMKLLAWKTQIDVVCPLHDAIYVACQLEEVDSVEAIVRAAMDHAATMIIGSEVRIKIERTLYSYEKPLRDKRGAKTFATVMSLLDEIETNPRAMLEEVEPKPSRQRPTVEEIV